eukprot:IDg2869t1
MFNDSEKITTKATKPAVSNPSEQEETLSEVIDIPVPVKLEASTTNSVSAEVAASPRPELKIEALCALQVEVIIPKILRFGKLIETVVTDF